MAYEIKVPSVGESVSEGTIAQWLKNDGDQVTKGENIVVIDTEKASSDLQADQTGTLRISVKAGTDVTIGQVIGLIEESAAGSAAAPPASAAKAASASSASSTVAPPAPNPELAPEAPQNKGGAPGSNGQVFDIKVPAVGESVSEGTIAQWLKKDGDTVSKGENIVVIDTEKASSDLQAEQSGILRTVAKEGQDVKIGEIIGRIEGGASSVAAAQTEKPLHVAAPQPQPGTAQPPDQVPSAEAKAAKSEGRGPVAPEPGQQVASPEKAAEAKAAAEAKSHASTSKPSEPRAEGDQPTTRETMSRMRRTIAAHLMRAKSETAMLTTFAEVDMSAAMDLRKKHQDAFVARHGIKLGFMSFFIKACCDALQKFPLVNASIEGNEIVYHHYVNMAVAVSTERGLAVPVIRDADQKSFAAIEASLGDLAKKARTGRIPLEDLKGGTFTITNGGVFGSLLSTPLINPPQVAILGMHAIEQRAVVINGKVEVRPMMSLALSYDHRLIDGKEAVQFLVHVRDHVAAPERLLLGL